MIVRLAFAVMAHVDADLLVIDEALAVGDAVFTQKCMRFIQRYRKENSLLFVSHDISAIQNLCDKAILLENGQVIKAGEPKSVIKEYTRRIQRKLEVKEDSERKTSYIVVTLMLIKHFWYYAKHIYQIKVHIQQILDIEQMKYFSIIVTLNQCMVLNKNFLLQKITVH